MGSGGKKPEAKIPQYDPNLAKGKKTPKFDEGLIESWEKSHPSWRFMILDYERPFGWKEIRVDDLIQVIEKLQQYETMTWADVKRSECHFIEHEKLSADAKRRLRELKFDEEIESLFSLRIDGKTRVFGIPDDTYRHALRILWFDPDHLVCPSPKKHT